MQVACSFLRKLNQSAHANIVAWLYSVRSTKSWKVFSRITYQVPLHECTPQGYICCHMTPLAWANSNAGCLFLFEEVESKAKLLVACSFLFFSAFFPPFFSHKIKSTSALLGAWGQARYAKENPGAQQGTSGFDFVREKWRKKSRKEQPRPLIS
jgi:hypothetical protein